MTTWLITGCSTGLGRALARTVLDGGDQVVVTARDVAAVQDLAEAHPNTALPVALDVTDRESVQRAVALAEERFGSVDVLVNNAGYGYRAAVEEGEDEPVRQLFDTHVHGAVRLMQTVLPGMRERRSGTIVNVSSIGARMSPAGSGYYAAAKAALEALTLSLRREVEPLGITAMTVEPGSFRTDFAGRSLTGSAAAIEDYADTVGPRRKDNDRVHGTQPGDPDKAASAIVAAVSSATPPYMLVLGNDAADLFRAQSDALLADLAAWDTVSRSTDF